MSEPHSAPGDAESGFGRYVRERLGAVPFAPDPERFEELAFAASLASFTDLARWAQGMRNEQSEALSFEVGYIERLSPDAFADRQDGVHLIGMNQGLLATIQEFALYVFTQSAMFPQIGDAAGEDSPPPQFGAAPGIFLLERTLRGEPVASATDAHRVPKDADRHVAAVYLAMLMTRFVWFHELAHCVKGHVAFLKANRIAAPIGEIPIALVGLRQPSIPPDQLRTLLHGFEREADATALMACCQVQLAEAENIAGIKALDLTTRLEMTLLAAYLMAWLFDVYQHFTDSFHDRTHPFPRTRLHHLVAHAHTLLLPELDGFPAFHAGIITRFNDLAGQIAGMHRIDDHAVQAASVATGAELDALLAPFRFAPVISQTED